MEIIFTDVVRRRNFEENYPELFNEHDYTGMSYENITFFSMLPEACQYTNNITKATAEINYY